MKKTILISNLWLGVALAVLQFGCATHTSGGLSAGSEARLKSDATAALQDLCAGSPVAADLKGKAVAILVFPDILKGGFMFGGQLGNGVLLQNGRAVDYYNTVAGSYGFQAGLQRFG